MLLKNPLVASQVVELMNATDWSYWSSIAVSTCATAAGLAALSTGALSRLLPPCSLCLDPPTGEPLPVSSSLLAFRQLLSGQETCKFLYLTKLPERVWELASRLELKEGHWHWTLDFITSMICTPSEREDHFDAKVTKFRALTSVSTSTFVPLVRVSHHLTSVLERVSDNKVTESDLLNQLQCLDQHSTCIHKKADITTNGHQLDFLLFWVSRSPMKERLCMTGSSPSLVKGLALAIPQPALLQLVGRHARVTLGLAADPIELAIGCEMLLTTEKNLELLQGALVASCTPIASVLAVVLDSCFSAILDNEAVIFALSLLTVMPQVDPAVLTIAILNCPVFLPDLLAAVARQTNYSSIFQALYGRENPRRSLLRYKDNIIADAIGYAQTLSMTPFHKGENRVKDDCDNQNLIPT